MNQIRFSFSYLKHRKLFYLVSVFVILVGISTGMIRGWNLGIDFTGGTMIQLDMGKYVTEAEVQKILKSQSIDAEVVNAGEENEQIIIRTTQALDNAARQSVLEQFSSEYGLTKESVLAVEQFGPSVGDMLKKNAVRAVLIASVFMLIYVAVRFEWKFGVAAILAILHDVMILFSVYGLFHIPINNPFIAAILTIVGYSINDTIVVFDRIRENLKVMKKTKLEELIDTSINQTLIRSIMTSATTVVAIIPLFILGGETIRNFTFPLIVGIIAGTGSSIFIASPIYFEINKALDKPKYRGK